MSTLKIEPNAKVQTIDRGKYVDSNGDDQLDDYWLLRMDGEARPGHFVGSNVAQYAMQFDDHTLKDLQDRANDLSTGTQGTITLRDLEMAYVKAELQHACDHLAREEWLDAGMGPSELVVFTMTIALWNRLVALPVHHDRDGEEWAYLLHKIQDKIAARPFFRKAVDEGADV